MNLEEVSIRVKNFVKGVSAKAEALSRQMPFMCLYPGCSAMPIDCHSQQCNGALSAIANDKRMVVVPSKDATGSISRMLDGAKATRGFHLVSINRATIFKGFCQRHDTALFADIETRPLVADDFNQALAFHRRAIAFEIRGCLELLGSFKIQKYLSEQRRIQTKLFDEEIQLAEKRLSAVTFFEWNPLWRNDSKSHFCYAWKILPRKLSISLSSNIVPKPDDSVCYAYSRALVSLGVNILPRLGYTLTIVPQNNMTHIVMVWNKVFDPVVKLYRNRLMSLDSSEVELFLNECVFCLSEDWCMNPNAWNAIPQSVKNNLAQKLSMENFYDRAKDIPRIITI